MVSHKNCKYKNFSANFFLSRSANLYIYNLLFLKYGILLSKYLKSLSFINGINYILFNNMFNMHHRPFILKLELSQFTSFSTHQQLMT